MNTGLLLVVKRPEREFYRLSLYRAEVKSEWKYNYTSVGALILCTGALFKIFKLIIKIEPKMGLNMSTKMTRLRLSLGV